MARLATAAAVGCERVRTEIVAVSEFPELAKARSITSVPRVDVDGELRIVGVPDEEAFVSAVCRKP